MHRQKHLQYAVITIVGLAMVFMSVGFYAYAQISNIQNVSATSRPVHEIGFDAKSYLESEDSDAAIKKSIKQKHLDFSIALEQPGDSYAALINIVNSGNVDEVLSEIQMSEISEELAPYVDYRLTLEDEDYVGTSYNQSLVFEPGSSMRKQLFIMVEYKEDAPNIGPINLDLSAALKFE